MNKKNIIIGSAIIAATFGILLTGSSYLTSRNENKSNVMAEELEKKEQVDKNAEQFQQEAKLETVAIQKSDIAIKNGKSYTQKKAELKKKIEKKKVAEKKIKKVKAKKDKEFVVDDIDYSNLFNNNKKKLSDNDKYKATLTDSEKKAFEAKNEPKKKLKANKKNVPDKFVEQSQGNKVKVDKSVVKDKSGKVVSKQKRKQDINDIINSCLKDENGKWIDNSEKASNEKYAKEHGLTVEEVEKMAKEGYFNNGEIQISSGGVGDGSPEDDAGMDFE
jgi:hypothetical protein